jgi:hypothetical protein
MQSFMKSRKALAAGAGVAAFAAILGGGVLGGEISGASPASALGSGTSALTSVVQQTNPSPPSNQGARSAAMEDYLQKLAKNLNTDENTLKAALKQTSLDQLAADVASGKITQAQADQAGAAIANGTAPLFGPGGFDRGGHGRAGGPGVAGPQDGAALAQFLGIDQATLEQAEHSGASLTTIASDHGKNRDQLKTFLTDQETARLKDAVTNGKLTQTQADQMQQRFASNVDARIDGTHTGRPMDHNGGPGRGTPGTQPSTNAN